MCTDFTHTGAFSSDGSDRYSCKHPQKGDWVMWLQRAVDQGCTWPSLGGHCCKLLHVQCISVIFWIFRRFSIFFYLCLNISCKPAVNQILLDQSQPVTTDQTRSNQQHIATKTYNTEQIQTQCDVLAEVLFRIDFVAHAILRRNITRRGPMATKFGNWANGKVASPRQSWRLSISFHRVNRTF